MTLLQSVSKFETTSWTHGEEVDMEFVVCVVVQWTFVNKIRHVINEDTKKKGAMNWALWYFFFLFLLQAIFFCFF